MTQARILLGIDLGTTYSAVAYIDEHGKSTVIPNNDNERITPSVVLFEEDEVIVGKIAKASATSEPERVVQFIKREMGNSDWQMKFFGEIYTPESISALILKRLVEDAQKSLGQPVGQVVITVPAYFGDSERKATEDAAEIAGIEVASIINEPTAAALAYGLDKLEKNQTVLVYDLGGGTFDVSVLEIHQQNIRVLATDGEIQLGGKDWDDQIINYLAEVFQEQHGIDPRDDLDAYQAMRDAAEMAKITLSRKPRARMICQCQGNTLKTELTREKFTEITRALLTQTETYLPVVLEKAKLSPKEIDTVLLVGGSTRMPQVREMLAKFFGKDPDDSANPDECVALGAAIYGALLQIQSDDQSLSPHYYSEEIKEVLGGLQVQSVTAHSLGILVKECGIKKNCILIPAQSKIPYQRTENYGTESDGQTRVLVEVAEGESEDVDECVVIGTCVISDLPSGRKAGAPVEVTFKYNRSGRIEVYAKDKQSGQKAQTEILRQSGLNQAQITEQKDNLQKKIVE